MLIRSWNVYHGMTVPPGRRGHLEEAVSLVTADGPDVVCLQEVPLWGLPKLESWSGMTVLLASARRVWFPPRLGGWITRLNQGFFRSGISGQGNATLLADGLEPLEHRCVKISRGQRERRICLAVRLEGLVIGNLHASGIAGHPEVGAAEIARALAFIEEFARPGDALVLAGDFNLRRRDFPPLHGWSLLGPGIDHILVRDAEASPLEVWPEARRTTESGVLSDHAPIELTVGIDDSGKLDG